MYRPLPLEVTINKSHIDGLGLFFSLNLTEIYAIKAITNKAMAIIIGFIKLWKSTNISMVGVAGGLKSICQFLGPPSANAWLIKLQKHVKKNKTFFTNKLPIRNKLS